MVLCSETTYFALMNSLPSYDSADDDITALMDWKIFSTAHMLSGKLVSREMKIWTPTRLRGFG